MLQYINCINFRPFQFRFHRWLVIIWGVTFTEFTEQSITGVTYRDNFDFEERYHDDHKCDPFYWHPLHMPEHCIKQYEKMIRSRVTRSKPIQVIKQKNKKHSYKYHAIDPETLPSSNELNSINNIISYNDLSSANNYNDLISSNRYNVPASPNNYNDLISSNQYRVPAASNLNNHRTSTSKYDVLTSGNQYYDPYSANDLDAPVEHINVDDLVPLRNGRRVDHGNDHEDEDNGNKIDHNQNDHHGDHGNNGDYESHSEPTIKTISVDNLYRGDYNHYIDLGGFGRQGDRSHYIDLGRHGHRGEYKDHSSRHRQSDHIFPRRKVLRKKHKKRVHKPEPQYSQESLELVYNNLQNVMNVEQFNMDDYDESSEYTRRRNHNSRHSSNRNRQRTQDRESDFLQDYKRILKENSDYGFIFDYGHNTKRGRIFPRNYDDEGDSYKYQYTLEHNYDDNYNDLSHEYDIDKYVNSESHIDTQNFGQYLAINPDPTITSSVARRRPRQNIPQDTFAIGDNGSPFSIESVLDVDSLSSDEEPVHIPIPGYQSPVQSMLQAIETDVRSQPIVPQIGVLPFLGVSAIYHQPISQNSVDLIKDVAHSYQEAAKEQYNEMAKYFPPMMPPPPYPLPDFPENVTTINPNEYYPGQRKDDKLMKKIRHKILENAKHFRKDGVKKHKVNKGGSSQDNIFMRQYK